MPTPSHDTFQIGTDYAETVELRDGTKARLELIDPSDRETLERAFHRLSSETRYRRFLGPKSDLSDDELDYLTDIDQYDHVAIGARVEQSDGLDEGIGVARCVRLDGPPGTAETAITVVDDYQGLGLGGLLLDRLVVAARERDIHTFRASLFARNRPMRKLLEDLGPVEVVERAGAVVTLDVRLDDYPVEDVDDVSTRPLETSEEPEAEESDRGPLARLLSMTASGAIDFVRDFRRAVRETRNPDDDSRD